MKKHPIALSALVCLLPVVWDAGTLELVSIENTEELIPNWYGADFPEESTGTYVLAWNNDTVHDGTFGKTDYAEDGVLCTMIFRAEKDLHVSELTMYVDTDHPVANIMNWYMEDHLHKIDSDRIFGENDFLFTSGILCTEGDRIRGLQFGRRDHGCRRGISPALHAPSGTLSVMDSRRLILY